MAALSELILLAFSFGTLNSWGNDTEPAFTETPVDFTGASESNLESKSLYDLMVHFPTDAGIRCPGSDSRFRYPGECSRYVTCRNYQAHIRSCPPGMSFDVNYGHCRLAFEVDCEDHLRFRSVCGPDEVYSDCKCERTCENMLQVDICEGHCDNGCFCRRGYVRDEAGNCVIPEDCEKENNVLSNLKSWGLRHKRLLLT